MGSLRTRAAESSIFLVSVAFAAIALEISFRIYGGVPVFEITDFTAKRASQIELGVSEYDPLLGWRLRANITSSALPSHRFTTTENGIRRNGSDDRTPPRDAILAVGDSFTVGSEVTDHESWPAYLEGILHEPVNNGAAGGYGLDQTVLRAEDLLEKYRPKMVIMGLLDQDILRVGFRSYGEAKPFFKIEDGELKLHNVPVPKSTTATDPAWARILGHSYVADFLIARLAPKIAVQGKYEKIEVDEVEVSCRLIERLAAKLRAESIPLLIVMQYGAGVAGVEGPRPGYASLFLECARELHIPVVDEFETLRSLVARDGRAALREHYVVHRDNLTLGHMSAKGNRLIAELVAAAVPLARSSTPVSGKAGLHRREAKAAEDDIVREIEPVATTHARLTRFESSSWRIEAAGENGEHYVVAGLQVSPGDHTLSLLARRSRTHSLRIGLVGADGTGTLADFDLDSGSTAKARLGPARRIAASMEQAEDGWIRLRVSTSITAAGATAIFQLLDNRGVSAFRPDGESIEIASPRLTSPSS